MQINRALYRFIFWLNLSPILRVSADDNFGTIPWTQEKRNMRRQYRISLISINLGGVILHLFSLGFYLPHVDNGQNGVCKLPKKNFSKGFRIFYLLRLADVEPTPGESNKSYVKASERHELDLLKAEDSKDYETFTSMLSYQIDAVKDTKNRSLNKFLGYLTVVALITPFYIPLVPKIILVLDKALWQQIILWAITFYIFINFGNLLYFFYHFIKINTYNRFSYITVRQSDEPDFEYLRALFHDKYKLQSESINEVTRIKNIEKYISGLVIMSIITLLFTGIILPAIGKSNSTQLPPQSNQSLVYKINISDSPTKFIEENSKLFENLKELMIHNQIREIILIRPSKNGSENYSRVVNLIQAYNVNETKVIEIVDTKPQEQQLQIITIRS